MIKLVSRNVLREDESPDKSQVAVSVRALIAGSDYPNISYYVYQPFLRGEDYPALVNVWEDDDIFDK